MFRKRPLNTWPKAKSKVSYSYELHCREAARWAGYTWEQFFELDADEQAATVAHYEEVNELEAVMQYDAERRAKAGQR